MPPLPVLSAEQMRRALLRHGFMEASQRGSHLKLRHPNTGRVVILPMHAELKRGTLRSLLRQAGLTVDELTDLLR